MSLVEQESRRTLLRFGAPACAVTALLAYLGNYPMQITILLGTICAYRIVKRRKAYPCGRILGSVQPSSERNDAEALSARLERHKQSVGIAALVWFGFLAIVCGFSLLGPSIDIHYLSGPDIVTPLVRIPEVVTAILTRIARTHEATAVQYLGLTLRLLDYLILLSLSVFFSVTGSSCLYWFFLYYKDSTSRI